MLRHSSTIFVIIQVLESLWEVRRSASRSTSCSGRPSVLSTTLTWRKHRTETAEKCLCQTVTWVDNTYFPVRICQMMGPSPKKATKRTSGEALTSTSPEPEYYPEDGQEDGTGDDYKNKRARYRKYVLKITKHEFCRISIFSKLKTFECLWNLFWTPRARKQDTMKVLKLSTFWFIA